MSEKILIGRIIKILQKENHPLSAKRLWELLKIEYDEQAITLGDRPLNPIKMQNYLSGFIKNQNIIIEPRTNVYYLKTDYKNHDDISLNTLLDQIFAENKKSLIEQNQVNTSVNNTIDVDVDNLPLDDLDVQIDEFGSRYQAFKAELTAENAEDLEGLDHPEHLDVATNQNEIEPLKLLSLIQAKSNIPAKIEAVQNFIQQHQAPAEVLWNEFKTIYQKILNEFHTQTQKQSKMIEPIAIDLSPRQPQIVFPPTHLKSQMLKILNRKNKQADSDDHSNHDLHSQDPIHQQSHDAQHTQHAQSRSEIHLPNHHPSHEVQSSIGQDQLKDTPVNTRNDQLIQDPPKRRQKRVAFKNQIDLSLYHQAEESSKASFVAVPPVSSKLIDRNDPLVLETLQRVRQLSESAFEKLIFEYLAKLGYYQFQKIHQQKGGRTAIYALSSRQQATMILAQLKHVELESKTVNLLIDNLHHFNAQQGMIITTGDIQSEAYALSKNKITLVDGQNFIQNLIKNEILVQDES